eukprot:TRINITY_DN303_c0_g1_i2.p1 TRINITY_DN303_c0_g1~~TRINITY_DN303_c0_g1_i2.p1  ORF type:complete len:238 (-),score=67.02 TRINITY_DN303_c0_g1_i2:1438-2151(-)
MVEGGMIDFDNIQCSVELLSLCHYVSKGWKGFHCEGSVYRMLFTLLMWDVIFAPIPDVFVTAFQSAPVDLFTEAFYESRKDLISAQLTRLRTGDQEIIQIMETSWHFNFNSRAVGANWSRWNLEELIEIALGMGPDVLVGICETFARNYKEWSAGLPDLLLWRKTEKKGNEEGGFEFEAMAVEVKGPRDRLMERQYDWIQILLASGLRVEMCHVSEGEDEEGEEEEGGEEDEEGEEE